MKKIFLQNKTCFRPKISHKAESIFVEGYKILEKYFQRLMKQVTLAVC